MEVEETITVQDPPSKKYYEYLKSQGLDVPPTFESFTATLSDKNTADKYYSYLSEQKKTKPDLDIAPNFDSFYNTLAVSETKKKSGRFIRAIRAARTAFLQTWRHP